MTLGELTTRKNLVGRVFRAHEKNGFAYRGIVDGAEVRGKLVCLLLRDHARRFEDGHRGTWKHLPDAEIIYGKNTPAQKTVGEIISFALPTGGHGYFYPRGTKLEEVENAPLV